MSNSLQPARGTKDILGDDMRRFRHVADTAKLLSERYGFEEVATPIFEFTEIFKRTLGDSSDIVSKEMYCFEDRGGESLTLRPEFTASIARAIISNGLTQEIPCKFFASGPLFRYERPQKGRFRQFHQINFELIGTASAEADIELISLGHLLLQTLGIDQHITLELNSLGDQKSRETYRTRLVEYLSQYQSSLSEDSQKRLQSNPLRILDSKNTTDQEIVADAPLLKACYSDEAKAFFDQLQEGLQLLNISYNHNPKLVRGLDYYCHTAFEFTTTKLGAQNAVLAGGRYDQLLALMGAKAIPSVGFAGGIERIAELMQVELSKPRPIVIIPMGELAEKEALRLSFILRKEGFIIDSGYQGNVGKRMKKANKAQARAVLLIGEDELKAQEITLKDMDQGSEERIKTEHIIDRLAVYR